MELVLIGQYPTTAEAAMARNCLADEGIEAVLADENTGDLFHLAASFGEVKLMVKADDAERSKEVLARVHDHTKPHGYHKPE